MILVRARWMMMLWVTTIKISSHFRGLVAPGAGDLKRCFSIHVKLMFIFQMSRSGRNWNFDPKTKPFLKKQTMVFLSLAFLLCLLLERTESSFDFPPYFFPLYFCRKVKISEVCKNCGTKPTKINLKNFERERRSSNSSSFATGSGCV